MLFVSFPHRSLDLTGPLFLGGVPNVPDNFPFGAREFIGCIKEFHIDSKPLDLAGFIANNGTVAGQPWHICVQYSHMFFFCLYLIFSMYNSKLYTYFTAQHHYFDLHTKMDQCRMIYYALIYILL